MQEICADFSVVSISGGSIGNVDGSTMTQPQSHTDLYLTDYLRPLKRAYMRKSNGEAEDGLGDISKFHVSCRLRENLCAYIWSPDVFRCPSEILGRIFQEMSAKFSVDPRQSDYDDLLKYHPAELVSSLLIKLVVGIAMIEPAFVERDFQLMDELIGEKPICLDGNAVEAYAFLLQNLKCLYQLLTTDVSELRNHQLPDYANLNAETKFVIKGLSALYMKAFRARGKERVERLRQAAENVSTVEWTLYLTEALRIKRRESKWKKPTEEESKFTERSLQMERDNPFVRLNIIDCVIDAVREWNGRFHCGDIIHLQDTDQAMHFLKNECRKLCQDFPRNVHFLSVVSDYFARYVPYLHFDKDLSGTLLTEAYKLSPFNAKTLHRLSIFYRMNLKDASGSMDWLEKTLEVDPAHFNANLDYLKTLIGKVDVFQNLGEMMENRLNTKITCGWRKQERSEFQFYVGLAYFAEGQYDDTLRVWMEVLKISELQFPLSDVDSDCTLFRWNNEAISTDKVRQWIQNELEKVSKGEDSVETDGSQGKKQALHRMFHLMLGILQPKRPDPFTGPYTEYFDND